MPQAPAGLSGQSEAMQISQVSHGGSRSHAFQFEQAMESFGATCTFQAQIESPNDAATKALLSLPAAQVMVPQAQAEAGLEATNGVATSQSTKSHAAEMPAASQVPEQATKSWASRVGNGMNLIPGPARGNSKASSGKTSVSVADASASSSTSADSDITRSSTVEGTSSGNVPSYFVGVAEYLAGQAPEKVLDNYEDHLDLGSAVVIGSGNFGDVLLVRGKASSQQFAIKVISMKQAAEGKCSLRAEGCLDDMETRVRKEIQTLQDVADHPNLVRLRGVLHTGNKIQQVNKDAPYVCIVTEYIADSKPLSKHISKISGLDSKLEEWSWVPPFAAQVMLQAARALSYMHQRGYVHRDVWSENMLINGVGHVVLVDLGCAERHDLPYSVRNKLNIPYMSLEAWKGLKQSPGDDCWSLGLVLSEIVTGRFLCNRLGGVTNRPLHDSPDVLIELQQETVNRGGPGLGKLCEELLMEHQTITMKDVINSASKILGDGQPSMSRQSTSQGSTSASSLQTSSQASLVAEHTQQASSCAEHTQQSFQPVLGLMPSTVATEAPDTGMQRSTSPARARPVLGLLPSASATEVADTESPTDIKAPDTGMQRSTSPDMARPNSPPKRVAHVIATMPVVRPGAIASSANTAPAPHAPAPDGNASTTSAVSSATPGSMVSAAMARPSRDGAESGTIACINLSPYPVARDIAHAIPTVPVVPTGGIVSSASTAPAPHGSTDPAPDENTSTTYAVSSETTAAMLSATTAGPRNDGAESETMAGTSSRSDSPPKRVAHVIATMPVVRPGAIASSANTAPAPNDGNASTTSAVTNSTTAAMMPVATASPSSDSAESETMAGTNSRSDSPPRPDSPPRRVAHVIATMPVVRPGAVASSASKAPAPDVNASKTSAVSNATTAAMVSAAMARPSRDGAESATIACINLSPYPVARDIAQAIPTVPVVPTGAIVASASTAPAPDAHTSTTSAVSNATPATLVSATTARPSSDGAASATTEVMTLSPYPAPRRVAQAIPTAPVLPTGAMGSSGSTDPAPDENTSTTYAVSSETTAAMVSATTAGPSNDGAESETMAGTNSRSDSPPKRVAHVIATMPVVRPGAIASSANTALAPDGNASTTSAVTNSTTAAMVSAASASPSNYGAESATITSIDSRPDSPPRRVAHVISTTPVVRPRAIASSASTAPAPDGNASQTSAVSNATTAAMVSAATAGPSSDGAVSAIIASFANAISALSFAPTGAMASSAGTGPAPAGSTSTTSAVSNATTATLVSAATTRPSRDGAVSATIACMNSNSNSDPSSVSGAISAESVVPAGAIASSASTAPAFVATPAPAPVDASPPASTRSFHEGQRIKYLARSNSVSYPGVIFERLPDLPGWSVGLDCLRHKEVHDKDIWRLQPE